MVAGGELPAVDARLPDQPFVPTPEAKAGKYDGAFRPWNN